jgi:hypothetical protein
MTRTLSCLGIVTCAALSAAAARGDGGPPAPTGPAAVDQAACLDAVSKGQRLRTAHKLVEAREHFRVCARAECPAVVQSDCTNWMGEMEARLPGVVLSAKDGAGRDVVDVKVSVDGQPLAGTLDGQAVAVDPGLRTFRFERGDGSAATQQVLVKEGDKAQSVSVVLSGPGAPSSSPAEAVAPASDGSGGGAPPASTPTSTARLLGLVLGGAGIVGMGVGAAVALDAKSKDDRAAGEPGTARQTDSSSAVSEGNVATVVLGVGAAMAVAGVILWLTAPTERVAVGTDGRAVILRGSF